MENANKKIIIWWFKDGKIGHEKQCLGLIKALQKYHDCQIQELPCLKSGQALTSLLQKQFPTDNKLNAPDLIIGAGHGCHISMLAAKRATEAKTIVLMKPSLPVSLFDLCLIPEHDSPEEDKNVITTQGVINSQYKTEKKKDSGIILIGGPSKHYDWCSRECIKQVKKILEKEEQTNWLIGDSRRSDKRTQSALKRLDYANAEYVCFEESSSDWLEKTLAESEYAWISEDSVSMIYEALSAGCKTGIIDVPYKKQNKLSMAITKLKREHVVTDFQEWLEKNVPLSLSQKELNEADRAARFINQSFLQANLSS